MQKEFLSDLYALQKAVKEDLAVRESSNAQEDVQSTNIESLQEEIKRLKYRIAHMKRYL